MGGWVARALFARVGCGLLTRLVAVGARRHRGVPFFCGFALCGGLLTWGALLVGKGNLAKIDKAFFDMNAYASVGVFVGTLVDEFVRRRG